MTKLKSILGICLLSQFLGCEPKYDPYYFSPIEPQLAIVGAISPDSVWVAVPHLVSKKEEIDSLYSHIILGDYTYFFSPVFDSTATVTLYRDGSLYCSLERRTILKKSYTNAYYRFHYFTCSIKPEAGSSYRIVVEQQGYPILSAETSIPTAVPITHIDTSTISEEWNNGFLIKNKSARIFFDDPVAESNYYFFHAYSLNWWDGTSTTFGTVSRSNIGETIIGEPILTWKEAVYRPNLLFNDSQINGKSYGILVDYSEMINNVTFSLYSLSREYYLFTHSLNTYKIASYDTFGDVMEVYSNVKGGKGIFVGYNRHDRVFVVNETGVEY